MSQFYNYLGKYNNILAVLVIGLLAKSCLITLVSLALILPGIGVWKGGDVQDG
jgi:hypothetical protein